MEVSGSSPLGPTKPKPLQPPKGPLCSALHGKDRSGRLHDRSGAFAAAHFQRWPAGHIHGDRTSRRRFWPDCASHQRAGRPSRDHLARRRCGHSSLRPGLAGLDSRSFAPHGQKRAGRSDSGWLTRGLSCTALGFGNSARGAAGLSSMRSGLRGGIPGSLRRFAVGALLILRGTAALGIVPHTIFW